MNVRPVSPDDAAILAAIYNYYVCETVISFETEPLSEGEMRERIVQTSAGFPYLVCEVDGQVVGYAYAHRWKERAAYYLTWESTIYLHREHCGQGLGCLLMEALLPQCRERGCRALIACITGENTASVAFHESLGFRPVSHFPAVGCKFGRLLDVVDLYLPLQ
ncbi:MAG: N-acetyltransferase [Akkermansia sp.]|nr:N-acetyltransferase [Akkermansia sp.]